MGKGLCCFVFSIEKEVLSNMKEKIQEWIRHPPKEPQTDGKEPIENPKQTHQKGNRKRNHHKFPKTLIGNSVHKTPTTKEKQIVQN